MEEEDNFLIEESETDFVLPESFLDKAYELTGGEDKVRGFVMFYITNKGNVIISKRAGSVMAELALEKTIENYVKGE